MNETLIRGNDLATRVNEELTRGNDLVFFRERCNNSRERICYLGERVSRPVDINDREVTTACLYRQFLSVS